MLKKLLGVTLLAFAIGVSACGGDDDGGDGGEGGDGTGTTTQQSECSSSADCEQIVCDCPDGPVNFTGCNVVNGVGTCATAANCSSDFGACD